MLISIKLFANYAELKLFYLEAVGYGKTLMDIVCKSQIPSLERVALELFVERKRDSTFVVGH